MSYPRIFERVYLQPLCVTAARFQSIHAFLLPRLKGEVPLEMNFAPQMARPNKGPYSGKRRQYAGATQLADGTIDSDFFSMAAPGVAVVPVYGALAKNLSAFEEDCGGGTDINGIEHALAQAVANPEISTIILDIDSPGGEVTGIPEFGAAIASAAAQKHVIAFTDAQMCSAAYWLGSQAGDVFCTGSAQVGSIGTYIAWLDHSVQMQMEGVSLQLFAAGKHKAMGMPGRGLTQDDRNLLTARVQEINSQFQSAVVTARPGVVQETMEGQTFGGFESEQRGLVDGVVASWSDLVAMVVAGLQAGGA